MDRRIEEMLEDYLHGSLTGARRAEFTAALATADAETRRMVEAFREHSRLLRSLRAEEELAPAPGFYARVMDRVEQQRVPSVWVSFVEPMFFKRLALATLALLVLLSVTVWSTPGHEEEMYAVAPVVQMAAEEEPIQVMDVSNRESSRDAILVNLTTYEE
jgi:anti-sigma factor RsiW